MRPDRVLAVAAAAFVAADAFGSVVAIRHDVAGEPFGVSIPLTVPSGLMLGWGAGVAAPWPMPLAALVTAARAGSMEGSAVPGLVTAGLGFGCIAGTLIEPVTYRRRAWTPAIRTAIAVNLAASAVLVAAGLRYVALSQYSSRRLLPSRRPAGLPR